MDLSKVLGEMYADDAPVSPASPVASAARPTAPEWADEAHLDRAFSNWTPGPPPEAPAAEHEMAAHRPMDDDLAAALTQALGSTQVYPEPVFAAHDAVAEAVVEVPETPVAYELAPAPVLGWTRGDDDVLPAGRSRGGRRFGRR